MMALPAPQWTSADPEGALLVAAASGQTSVVQLLLRQGVDADAADERGLSPLMLAARDNCCETMQALLDGGADIDLRRGGTDSWPALMHAINRGHRSAAHLLLDRGADPNACARCGYSALMMASGCGDRELVAALLARGADAGARQALGFTAVDYAIGYGHSEIARDLIAVAPDLRSDLRPARRAVVELATLLGYGEILAQLGEVEESGVGA